MGFKDEAREAFANLVTRVETLEALARQLRASTDVSTLTRPATARPATTVATGSAVDAGAIAFGLSEIKRKVAQALSGDSARVMADEYVGIVQYFSDVLAKADPSFDAAEFRRQAGA